MQKNVENYGKGAHRKRSRKRLLNFRLKPRRPSTPCVQQESLPSTELAKLTKHCQSSARIIPNTKTNIIWSSRRKPTKKNPSRNLQESPFVLWGSQCITGSLSSLCLFNPVNVSLCPHSLHFQTDFSKLNELHISCSTANTLNLFGGQNLTENPIKALALSVRTGTISRNSHMSWVPWGLKTSVPLAASFCFLSALNLRNTWQLTSACKNYVILTNFKTP